MRARFNQSFKIQAVEKALNRDSNTSVKEVAVSLGVGSSTLQKWIVKARNQEFDIVPADEINRMTQDKRPQDWTLEERLNMVIACSSLDGEKLSEYCREQGVYPHHARKPKSAQANDEKVKTLKKESPNENSKDTHLVDASRSRQHLPIIR